MVPPAISVIYCHLRWQDGSLWHWPLADPTFFSGWRIKLGVTPLSDIRMYLRGRSAAQEENNSWILLLLAHWRREGCDEATPCFVSPKRQETFLLRFTLTGPPSVRLPLFCFPPFHFTSRNLNRHYMWWRKPFSCVWSSFLVRSLVELLRTWPIWLYRPKL